MKYFVDSKTREASGHTNYIELRLPSATEEFWDATSLYLSEEILHETGFGEFWSNCTREDIVFDMSTLSEEELIKMEKAAAKAGGEIPEILSELREWIDSNLHSNRQIIEVNRELDRELARRRAQREAYPVDPKFREEVRELSDQCRRLPLTERIAETEEAYEDLLRKYHMPSCFFPLPLFGPDKCEEG